MMDELRDLIRELKHPALLVALGSMIVLIILLLRVRFTIA